MGVAFHGDVAYDNAALLAGTLGGFRLDGSAIFAAGRGDVAKGLAAHLKEHHRLLFLTKMADYRDEQEYRYAVFDGTEDDYVCIDTGDALIAVVLGEAFPSHDREDAAAMCTEQGVAIRVMDWREITPLAVPFAINEDAAQRPES